LSTPEITAYQLFNRLGRYELYYFLTDKETGNISPLHRSFVYKEKYPLCALTRHAGSILLVDIML